MEWKKFCEDKGENGSITYFCAKEKGHKGRHGSKEVLDDGRILTISWTNRNKEMQK
jgi:hypothetical protein